MCSSTIRHRMETKTPVTYTVKIGNIFIRPTLSGGFKLSSMTSNGKYFSTIAFRIPFRLICWSLQDKKCWFVQTTRPIATSLVVYYSSQKHNLQRVWTSSKLIHFTRAIQTYIYALSYCIWNKAFHRVRLLQRITDYAACQWFATPRNGNIKPVVGNSTYDDNIAVDCSYVQ